MTEKITNIPSLPCNTVQIKKIGDEEVAVDVSQHKNTFVTTVWLLAGYRWLTLLRAFIFWQIYFFIVTVEKTKYMYP